MALVLAAIEERGSSLLILFAFSTRKVQSIKLESARTHTGLILNDKAWTKNDEYSGDSSNID